MTQQRLFDISDTPNGHRADALRPPPPEGIKGLAQEMIDHYGRYGDPEAADIVRLFWYVQFDSVEWNEYDRLRQKIEKFNTAQVAVLASNAIALLTIAALLLREVLL